ncbi:hypothetical protein GCM10009539_34100 [Cryptosporangium japonicum]|uniref:Lipoprotein n=2 Tax=Cryptosporangium japonicum TaxID=80872 RepID=A0ABN0UCC4_9ACTN
MRTRAVVLVVAIVVGVVGCSADEPAPRATPGRSAGAASFVAPALALPRVAPGAPCPLTKSRAWSGPGQAVRVLGEGPLYPIADYFGEGGATLELRPDDKQPDGTYGEKVRWLSVGYTGPVLIRGGRIDGTGRAGARFLYWGEPRDGGWFAVLPDEEGLEYVDLPGATTVSGPGCYALQVDGTNFSRTIVFNAVPSR